MGRRNPRYHPNCAIFAPLYPLTRETPRLFAAGRCSSLPQERMAGTAAAWLSHSAEFSATASLKSTNRFFVPIVFAILQFGFIISGFLLFVNFQTCKTPAKKAEKHKFFRKACRSRHAFFACAQNSCKADIRGSDCFCHRKAFKKSQSGFQKAVAPKPAQNASPKRRRGVLKRGR